MENRASKPAPNRSAKSPDSTQHERVVDLLTEFYAVMGNAPETVGAINAMAHALLVQEQASELQIGRALYDCRRCKFPVRLPHILEQLEAQDGRPDPEQAWAICPTSEEQSVVWTEDVALAFGTVRAMGDSVAARMAFKEAYVAEVRNARRAHLPVRWKVSLGFDKADRVRAVAQAVTQGKMLTEHALQLIGDQENELLLALPPQVTKALPGEVRRDISKLTGLHRVVAEFAEAKGMEDTRFPNGNPKLNVALVQARALGEKA